MDGRKFKSLITPLGGDTGLAAWRLFLNRFGVAIAASTLFDTSALFDPVTLFNAHAGHGHLHIHARTLFLSRTGEQYGNNPIWRWFVHPPLCCVRGSHALYRCG
jgi:hypothetical protein